MTERLYYGDAALLGFDAVALAHADGDPLRVVLDRTAFYPTSGGQPHDTGTLGRARVLDVHDAEDMIVHLTDRAVPLGPVRGEIDPARRRDHMEQHTAQHLLSAIAADVLGWETASVHFGAVHSTIEFAVPQAGATQLDQLEDRANAVIAEHRLVDVTFEDAAEAAVRGLRKASDRAGSIRVITISGIDRSACGGTHVANTGALGAAVLQGVEKVRGHLRVGFIAGQRVRQHLHAGDQLLATLAQHLSSAPHEVAELVPRRLAELKELRDRAETVERELALLRVRTLAGSVDPDADGVRRVLQTSLGEPASLLRGMAQAAGATERLILVLMAPPAILVGAGPGSGLDAGARLKALLAEAGGRGGGSATVAQGTVPDPARLDEVARALLMGGAGLRG